MLPAQQEAHEVLRRHRLDLTAQAIRRVAMDAGEEAPLAELDIPIALIALRIEAPAQREALGLELGEGLLDGAHGSSDAQGEIGSRRGPHGGEVPARRGNHGRLLVDVGPPR